MEHIEHGACIKGKHIPELIISRRDKLAYVPSKGDSAAAFAAPGGGAASLVAVTSS